MTPMPPRRMPCRSEHGAGGDGCQWNPAEDRESTPRDSHFQDHQARVLIGRTDPWRLCEHCSKLDTFRKFRNRKSVLIASMPTGTIVDDVPEGRKFPYKDLAVESMGKRIAVIRTALQSYSVRVYFDRTLRASRLAESRVAAHTEARALASYHGLVIW